MQPTQNPNIQPQPGVTPEQQPAVAMPEIQPAPVAPEVAPAPAAASPAIPVSVPVIPNVPLGSASPATSTPSQTPGSPAIADDVDVIEKEWVDQADKVVRSTSGDPYTQEEAVENLQIDYLKKRYGHDVKKPESS